MAVTAGWQDTKTFAAGAAVSRGGCLKLSSGQVIHTTAADDDMIGVALNAAAAQGDPVTVALRAPTVKMIAGAAITAGAVVMLTTAGKVITRTTTNAYRGIALEAAAADGDIIEVLTGGYKAVTPS